MTEADKLRKEAKDILNSLLNLPVGISSGAVERFVDCVVFAAVLEVATLQKTAMQSGKVDDEQG